MENQKKQFAYWESPISAEMVANAGKRFTQVQCDAGKTYWLETRPDEAGRQVIMCLDQQGNTVCLTPKEFNVRSRVHEYGGGDYLVADEIIYFVNNKDQCVYKQGVDTYPERVTSEDSMVRYADFSVTDNHEYLIAVRETHSLHCEPCNEIIAINLRCLDDVSVLVSGADFYSNPRLSPDGKTLVWLSWSHPKMPWDGTELWSGQFNDGFLHGQYKVAGSTAESLYQPEWNSKGVLYIVSDRTGWWNIYLVRDDILVPCATAPLEFGTTQWVFGTRCYGFGQDDRLFALATGCGQQQLGEITNGVFMPFPLKENTIAPYLAIDGDIIAYIGGSESAFSALYQYDYRLSVASQLCCSTDIAVSSAYISVPEPIEFLTEDDLYAHAFFYRPAHPSFTGLHELPPLIVFCHSGPIAATSSALNLKVQYWTSRGFAVVDVNYGGSSGYGRAYRDRLKGQWGAIDVTDCVNAARYLVKKKAVDPTKCCIRGSSAGGLTALSALTYYDDFVVGASYYGIADLTLLLDDTHKFESKTLEALVGEYPLAKEKYEKRSPIHFAEKLTAPVIFFQGLKDQVVLPAQAETMIAAMKKNRTPYRYITFDQEGHGFRDAQNIAVALREELAFYQAALYTNPL